MGPGPAGRACGAAPGAAPGAGRAALAAALLRPSLPRLAVASAGQPPRCELLACPLASSSVLVLAARLLGQGAATGRAGVRFTSRMKL